MSDATAAASGRLLVAVLISADSLGQSLALLATFGGIGIVVTVLIVFVIAQVMAEHKQNQESGQRN